MVSLEELISTVERMEARLPAHPELRRVYEGLVPRFEKDLGASPRDVALAKSAALMVVQALAKQRALINVDTGDYLGHDGQAVALVHRDDGVGNVVISASRPPACRCRRPRG